MNVYRIVKGEKRTHDLSGTGAFLNGGRWNSKGNYMLYSSENSSLSFLEILVHAAETILPADLFITTIVVKDDALIYTVKDDEYPFDWQKLDNLANKAAGNNWMAARKFLGFKVRSAVNASEYKYLLNPLFFGYQNLVEISEIIPLNIDWRLIR